MKRRILSFIMSMAVCLTLCPTWAAAEGEPEGGAAVTETAGAEAVESGPAPGGEVPAGEDPALENDRNTPPSDTESAEGGEDTMPAEPTPAETDTDTDTNTNTTPPAAEGGTPPTDTTPAEPAPSDIPAGDAGAGDAGTSDTQPEPDPKLCDHHTEHTKEICGYVPADENGENGSPCTYECQYCPIEALIKKLPADVTDVNKDEVSTTIEEIRLHIDTLSLNTSLISNYDKYTDIKAQLEKLDEVPRSIASVELTGQQPFQVETLAEAFTSEYNGAKVYLGRDAVLDSSITIPSGCSFTLDLQEWSITGNNALDREYYFNIPANSSLTVEGSGSITTTACTPSKTQSGVFQVEGTLTLNGGTFQGQTDYAIVIADTGGTAEINDGVNINCESGSAVHADGTAVINGGTFTGDVVCSNALTLNGGTFNHIEVWTTSGKTLKDVLGNKDNAPCAYFLEGELLTDIESQQEEIIANNVVSGYALNGNITVDTCTHNYQAVPNENDAATHTKTCLACNLPPVVNEPCTFEQNPDKEPTAKEHFGTCPDCGRVWDGAHTGEWSEDGRRTCTVCGLEQVAIAKMVRNNQTTEYLTELGDGTGDKIEYNGVADDCLNLDLTLLQDVPLGAKYIELKSQSEAPMDFCFTLDLNGHTLSSDCSGAAVRINGGYFKLKDSSKTEGDDSSIGNGKIEGGDIGICLATANSAMAMEGGTVSGKTAGIAVNGGLFLRIGGDKVTAAEGGYGLRVLNQIGEIQLSGGVFQGIECSEDSQMTLADLIGTRYAYYRGGKPVSPSADDESGLSFDRSKGEITVKVCAHEGQAQDNGDGTHGGTCAACGTELTAAAHVWNNEANPTACTVCGGKVIAKMDKMVGETITTEYLTKLLETANNDLAYKKDYDGATLTLLQDVDMKGNHIYLGGTNGEDVFSFTLDLNGHTLSSVHGEGVVQIGICNLTLMDGSAEKTGRINGGAVGIKLTNGVSRLNMLSGTVTGGNAYANAAINVHDPSTVNISGGTLVSEYYGLFVENSSNPSKITITGGDFQGSGQLILCQNSSGNTLADLLGEKDGQKCVYYRNRKPIAPNADGPYQFNGENGAVSVRVCGHEGQLLDLGNGTHGGTCHGCGEAIPAEPHVTDENGNCTLCSEKAAAKIEKEGEQPQYYAAQDLPTGYTNMSHDGETLTLLQDVNLGEEYIKTGISYGSDKFSFTLDLNGHTLTSANSSGAVQIGSCNFTLTDGSEDKTGTIAGEGTGIQLFDGSSLNMTGGRVSGGTGISVGSGASLNISGGTVISEDGDGLCVEGAPAALQLTGGTFQGRYPISCQGDSRKTLADLLGEKDGQKCAYYRDGKPIAPNADGDEMYFWGDNGAVTVQPCTHEGHFTDLGDGTHGGTCDYCGTELTPEAHVWDNAENPTACTVCGGKVIAKMDKMVEETITTEYLTKLGDETNGKIEYNKENYHNVMLILLDDVPLGEKYIELNNEGTDPMDFVFSLDLNGHILSSTNPNGAVQINGGFFRLLDSSKRYGESSIGKGRIDGGDIGIRLAGTGSAMEMQDGTVSGNTAGIAVNGGSFLDISGGKATATAEGGYGLRVAGKIEQANKIIGGTFQGIECSDGSQMTLAGLLREEFAYYREDGQPVEITKEGTSLTGTVTVQSCKHEGQIKDLGNGTHGGTCAYCTKEFETEAHIWNTDTADGIPACTGCGVRAIAEEKNEPNGETKYITKFQKEYDAKTNISIKLLQDVALVGEQISLKGYANGEYKFALDLNGKTLSSDYNGGVIVIAGRDFTLTDSSEDKTGRIDGGKIGIQISQNGILNMEGGTVSGGRLSSDQAAIQADSGSTVNISGGVVGSDTGKGLYVAKSYSTPATIQLTGGTFKGSGNPISCASGSGKKLAGLLAPGYAYYRGGKPIAPNADKSEAYFNKAVTVQLCTHEDQIKDLGDGKHGGTCNYCGTALTPEAHVWDNAENPTACTVCGGKVIAKMEKPDGTTEYLTKLREAKDDPPEQAYNSSYSNATLILLQNVNMGENDICINGADPFTLDLNGHTLSSSNAIGAVWIEGGSLILKDSSGKDGKIEGTEVGIWLDRSHDAVLNMESGTVSGKTGIYVNPYSALNISGGVVGSSEGKGLYIEDSSSAPATIQLTGGTFNIISCAESSGNTLKTILAENHAYFKDSVPVTDLTDASLQIENVTVGVCGHPESIQEYVYQGVNADNKHEHKQVCLACGREIKGSCIFIDTENADYVDESYHTSACPFCKHEIQDKPHVFSGMSRKSEDGLTTYYYKRCNWCGYEKEPYGTITTSEKELTLTYGETAQMSVDAAFDGIDSYTYQWTLDGANISEESTYSLPTDLAAGEHTYICRATIGGNIYRNDFKVTVNPKTITDAMVKISSVKTTYTGLDQKPEITIDGLEKDTDYTESWSREDFTNVGTMTLTVTGTGNYAGTVTKTFAIEAAKPVVSWKTPSQTLTYTGSPAEIEPPTVTLVNNEAFDGTIVYSYKAESSESFVSGLPINAGKYSVRASIPAKGNYTAAESPEMSLTIEKSQPTIAFKASYKPDKTYDRQTIPNPAAAEMEITGADFKDVRFTWSGTPLNAGSYTLTAAIDETPNTKKTETSLDVTIDRKTVTAAISAEPDSYTYTGKGIIPDKITAKDGETVIPASEYTVEYSDNINVGTAKIIVTNKEGGNYVVSGTGSFAIVQKSIAGAAVNVSGSFTYTGAAHEPAPTVTLDGVTLVRETDYTVTYVNNTNAGTATVTVTGKGNYTRSESGSFVINPAKPVISWKNPSQALTYTGSAAEIEPPTVTLVNNEAFDGTIAYSHKAESAGNYVSGLPINAGKYSVRASIPAKGNYTAAESTEMTLTIEKSQPTIAFKADYKPDKTYDGETISNPTEGDLEITGAAFQDVKFTWSKTPRDAGTYILTASIAETANTKKAETPLEVTISPKTVSSPVIELTPETFEYDGQEKKPSAIVKDGETIIPASEYTVEYSDNINAGTAKVTLADNAGGNYTVSGSKTFEITKAALESVTLETNSYTYDGTAKAPTATVKKGNSIVAPGEYETSYSNTNGGEGNHTDAGTVTVTITARADGNYTGTCEAKFVIYPKQLTVAGVEVQNRKYDGTNRVRITGVSLSGRAEGDEAAVNTENLYGTVSGSDAGTYTSVSLPEMRLTGADKANYTLARTAAASVEATIEKAPALTPKSGDLAVANGREHIYTYGVGGLLPDVPEGMSLGSSAATYTLGEVSLGKYYSGIGAKVESQVLTLPVQSVESEEAEEIGTITIIIHTGNFEDMTAMIHVRSVNKIIPEGTPKASPEFITYGQALNAVTLSGVMRDTENNRDVPGTFTWSSPENRPAVQEKYAAAWVFTPEDNDTYAIVTGTVLIQVKPASIQEAVVELNQNSFRYDGNAQSPVIISVKLGDTILTEGTDYTAVIPAETEPGEYAVTITGTGNYTGTAEKSFRINPVEPKPVEGNTELRLEVETGLSTVPEALKENPELDTPEKIETALRTKVEQVLDNVEERISVFDITLQYRDSEGIWHNVEPDNFPKDGVTTILPYPDGTGPTGFKFTIQHMISSGEKAGEVEEITGFELTDEGLKCKFWSLSPVAIGYEEVIIDPPTPPTPSKPAVTASDSDDGEEEAPDLEYEFWQDVRDKIEAANPGTTIRANAHGYDRMPRFVMDALRKSDNVTLVIRWDGGEDIVIPSSEALNEARRIYYPLSYLEGYRFNRNVPEEKAVDFSKQNPATGGFWEEDTPADVEAAFSAVEKAEITNPQRGLAETPELADKGIEKMIPGVYEPDTTEPEIQQAIETETLPTEAQNQDNRSRKALAVLALMLVAVCGGVWGWKHRKHWFRNPKSPK